LRTELTTLYQNDLKQEFISFWSAGDSEVKTALLMTALEDAANVHCGFL
jgi:hypothetical protein